MRYGSRGICVRTALHLDRSLEYVKDDRMNIAGFIKRKFGNRRGLLDYSLFFIVLFLLSFGLVMLYSTSSYEAAAEYGDSAYYLKRQMIFTLFGLVLMTGVSMIPYTLWKKLSGLAYLVSLVLILLVIPFGMEVNGAKRWIRIPGCHRILCDDHRETGTKSTGNCERIYISDDPRGGRCRNALEDHR